jgi:hypothetical protein
VRLARKPKPEAVNRPALRRVAREPAEPQLVEVEPAPADEGDEAGAAEPAAAEAPKSFLGRMFDALRGRSAEPAAPVAAPDEPGPDAPTRQASATVVAPAPGSVTRMPRQAAPPSPPPAAPPSAPTPPSAAARGVSRTAGPTRAPRALSGRGIARSAAAAAAPAIADAAPARPALSLVQTAPPEPAESPAPASGPQELLRSALQELDDAQTAERAGVPGEAVEFTGPGIPEIPPFSTTPVTMSRFTVPGLPSGMPSIPAGGMPPLPPVPSGIPSAPPLPGGLGGLGDAASGLVDQGAAAGRGLVDQGLAAGQGLANQGLTAAQNAAGGALDAVAGAVGGKAADPEEIYEQVLERLRRDLVAELEQNGHLLRDHP